jgi:predicted dehydrogenase
MPDDRKDLTRRELLKKATLAGGLAALGGVWTEADAHAAATAPRSPNEKLDVACIGVGGQGASDLREIAGDGSRVNIVALCDVNDEAAAESNKRFPRARTYRDFRRMLDAERRNIDAVVISTPDHTHAVATALAMRMGKHVYCQKPLTHTVSEARALAEIARRQKVVTQMGNQGHPAYARTVEYVRSGIVGPIRAVHVMTDRPIWPQGMDRPRDAQTPPPALDWDLWLGPAAGRPYHPAYQPFVWRGWWDFGTGALGDMACHLMDGAFWALRLGAPLTVEAEGEPRHPDSAPKWSIVRYAFGDRGPGFPPVTLTWYDGGKRIPEEQLEGVVIDKGFNGSLFVGDRGKLLVEHGGEPRLLPEFKFAAVKPPAVTLTRPVHNHYQEWVEACRNGGGPTGSNFDYAGPMTEAILLGNVAFRVGKRLEWDPKALKAKNCPEADAFIQHRYRKGWSL